MIVAAVMVVIALIIAAVVAAPIIGAVILLVGLRSPANVFLDLLARLINICPLLHHREQVLD
jgi:hypothetical protein